MSEAESKLDEKVKSRQVLVEINNVGLSDKQRIFLIYLLSLELEDQEACHDLSIVARSFCESMGILIGSQV